MKYREVIKLIKANGCYLKRQKGSHRIYRHRQYPGI
ncbi:MAG: type II toxin-antitoxin system HicA family toxin [Bacteroidetes bacterium]|nr:type II toxin-antitoxin system HicA family toxin [Bacteroidota bacterium]